jgi:uncharacterized protein (UPF0303 family)
MTHHSDLINDLTIIAKQEELLAFDSFDNATAWLLGESIKKQCEDQQLSVTIEIRLCRETIFFYAMPGTSANNTDWARRKRNTTELLEQSSYAVGLALARDSDTLQSQSGLPFRDYASHGGSFPIRIKGVGAVGAATVSGLPHREDHKLVVQALATVLKKPLDQLLLS